MAHTPGPWTAIPDSGEDSEGDWYILTDDEEAIATGLSEPDAHLIAAAPDLLAALQSVVRQLESRVDPLQVAQQARDAIAKAEGG